MITTTNHYHQEGQAADQVLSKMMLPAEVVEARASDDVIESVGQKHVHYSRAYTSDPDLALLNNTCR